MVRLLAELLAVSAEYCREKPGYLATQLLQSSGFFAIISIGTEFAMFYEREVSMTHQVLRVRGRVCSWTWL